MDIATLGLAVDSREVVDASKDLDRIRDAAARAEKQADSFGKRVEDAGMRAAAANDNAARSAGRASKAYEGYSKAATVAARAIGAIAGAAIGSALVSYADAWSDMQSRVGAAIKDMDAAPALMQRIVDIANASYSPLDQTIEVYSRNVAVLRDLGRGAIEAADFTEALNHALVVTATRGERAASVQNALSKAMAVGKLQADGLETVLANGGRVAEALAAQLGTNVNGLRKFATQGKITGDVIASALIGNLEKLRAEAAEMPATIGDAFTRIQTNLTAFIGQMDKAARVSETVAGALLALADNIGRVITYGATAVTMFGTYYVAAFVAANAATLGLAGSLALLRAALIRTGIGALVIAAGELVYQFGKLVQATGGWAEALQELGRRAEILLDAVVWGFRAAGEAIQSIWLGAMADILRATEDAFGGILRTLGISAESMSGSIERLEKQASAVGELSKTTAGIAADQFKRAFEEIKLPGMELPNTPGVRAPSVGEVDKAAQKAAKAYKKIVDGAKEFIATQELERQAIGMTELEAGRLRHEMDLLNQAKQAGITLTAAQTAELQGLAAQMAAAEQAAKAAKATQDAYNEAAQSAGGMFKGLMDRTKEWKDSLLELIPVVLKLLNTMNVAGGGKGIFGGGIFQSFLGGLLGVQFAKGGVFDRSGVTAFAKGGIVSKATVFPFAKGIGLMGEAGPEAIMPLHRGPDGGLGVRMANQNHANNNQPLRLEIVSRFDADGGFESAVERSSRPIAQQESAKAAGQVAKSVPKMVDQRVNTRQTRNTRA